MKCVKYWPAKGETAVKGDLTIETTDEDELIEYTIRKLSVTQVRTPIYQQIEYYYKLLMLQLYVPFAFLNRIQ